MINLFKTPRIKDLVKNVESNVIDDAFNITQDRADTLREYMKAAIRRMRNSEKEKFKFSEMLLLLDEVGYHPKSTQELIYVISVYVRSIFDFSTTKKDDPTDALSSLLQNIEPEDNGVHIAINMDTISEDKKARLRELFIEIKKISDEDNYED